MKLRLQYKPSSGPPLRQAVDLDDLATLTDLLAIAAKSCTLDKGTFTLKQGFPPKLVEGEATQTLAALGIRSGTSLIVDLVTGIEKEQARGSGSIVQKKTVSPDQDDKIAPKRQKLVEDAMPSEDDAPEVHIPGRGLLTLRVQPDDNSCLFRALGYLCMRSIDAMQEMRAIIAQTIQDDPLTYSDAVLGMSQDAYCSKMNRADTWGGEIEIQILSQYFNVQVANIDCQTGKIYRYGEEFDNLVLIVYSGIHYDALALAPFTNAPPDMDQTQFSKAEAPVIEKAAKELVDGLRKRHYFTDTAGFALRCQECGKALKGEKEAQMHASQTGHTRFGEHGES